ncbi:micronuclear linker histone poly -like, partial [Pelobates cultripes]
WLRQSTKSLAPSTWSSYAKVWKEWEETVEEVGGDLSEGHRLDVFLWLLCRLFAKGASPAMVDRHMSALAFWFKFQGWEDLTKHFLVRQAVRGFRRGKTSTDVRRPVSFAVLQGLVGKLPELCSSPFEVVLFSGAFVWAFFGAFRIGELVSANKVGVGGLQREDVEVKSDRVQIRLGRSKTDVFGKGCSVVLFELPGSGLCPVACGSGYLGIRPNVSGCFFLHADGTALSRFQFIRIFRLGLVKLGLQPTQFGSHSFRIGAATEAARLGLGDERIKRIGRWESVRFRSLECLVAGTL